MSKLLLKVAICTCLLQVCTGGLYKKLFKGLSLNAAEKAYADKIRKFGVRAVIMKSAEPTRQDIVKKRDEKTTTRSDRRILERSSERAKISISRRLARLTGKGDEHRAPTRRAIGGGRPRPVSAIESSPRRRRSSALSKAAGDGDAEMLTGPAAAAAAGDSAATDSAAAAAARPGWRFDEAQRLKLAGERAYLRKMAAANDESA
jgi:hypothetical protein